MEVYIVKSTSNNDKKSAQFVKYSLRGILSKFFLINQCIKPKIKTEKMSAKASNLNNNNKFFENGINLIFQKEILGK